MKLLALLLLASCSAITPDEFGISAGRGDLNYAGSNESGNVHGGDADTYVALAHLTWYLGTPVVKLAPETLMALARDSGRDPGPVRVVVNEAQEAAPEEPDGLEIMGIPIQTTLDAVALGLTALLLALATALGGRKVYRKIKKENGE